MCEFSNVTHTEKCECYSKDRKSVQNLIKKFERLDDAPLFKVRTDSVLKVRNYFSIDRMNEQNDHIIPSLNQNVVAKFLQTTQDNKIKSSDSLRESKQKIDANKRSESFRQETKHIPKTQGNKTGVDSFFNKYFRSLSDSKSNKRNPIKPVANEANTKWYPNDVTSKHKGSNTKGKSTEKPDNVPKKKATESTVTKPSIENKNTHFKRKESYVLAMETDYSTNINIKEAPKEENRNSFVSKTISKFEEQLRDDIKQEVKSDVEKLFKNYHQKEAIKGESSREKLTLEINDVVLDKYKQLKATSNLQLSRSNSKTEPSTSAEANEEVEYITLVYNEEDGKLTKYSKEECGEMEADYVIIMNESTDQNFQNNKEIKVIKNGSLLDLNENETVKKESKSVVSELCDKIQEQLNDVIKEFDTEIEETFNETMNKYEISEKWENKFGFWTQQNSIEDLENKKELQSGPDIQISDMGYDTQEEKADKDDEVVTQNLIDKLDEKVEEIPEIKEVEDDAPNITNKRRSSYFFSSISTNSDASDDKTNVSSRLYRGSFRRSYQKNEENKNKIEEARNSFFNELRFICDSNNDDKNNDNIMRRSFRNSIFSDKKEDLKKDEKRNSYIKRRSSFASSSSHKNNEDSHMKTLESPTPITGEKEIIEETTKNIQRSSFVSSSSFKYCDASHFKTLDSLTLNNEKEEENDDKTTKNTKRASIASCSSYKSDTTKQINNLSAEEKKKNEEKIGMSKANRSNSTLNVSESKREDKPRKSVLHSESFKRLSLTKDNEEISGKNKVLLSKNSSFSSISSCNSDSNKMKRNRLYSGSFRRSSTQKSETEEQDIDNTKNSSLARQDTPRLSRLYNGTFRCNSKKNEKTDDNNNTCDASKNEEPKDVFVEDKALQFSSDNEEDTVEIYNQHINCVSKDYYTKEWVQNTVKILQQNNNEVSHPIEQFSSQLRTTVDKDGLETCTLYDEENNPAIRLSCYEILKDMCSAQSDEADEEQKKMDQSEMQYRESIKDIQNHTQMSCLIAELKGTEHNYTNLSLRRLVEDYMPEMSNKDLPPTLFGKIRTIFGNADILYENHKNKFLPALDACQSIEEIAQCFLKNEEKIFKYYPLYTRNKPKSEAILKDFSSYFKMKQEQLEDRLDLSSYLLTPIQRMAKYCQLVKSLVKECDKEKKPCDELKRALNMLDKVMRQGNDAIALDQIINFDGDLRQEGELLIRDTFIVQPPNRKQSYEAMIFLFQESILITAIKRFSGSEYFDYQDSIKVCDMGYTDNEAEPLVFNIWYRKRDQKNYVIRAKKKETQQKWVKEIFNLLWKQLEANKMRKKKEYEECGMNDTKIPLMKRSSIPNNKCNTYKSRTNSTLKKKTTSETIWYGSFMKKFDFSDS